MVSSGGGVINQIITILPNQIRSNWNYQLGREVLQIKRVLEIIVNSLFTRNLKECKSNLKEKETESSATLLDHASLQFTFLCIFCCFCHFFPSQATGDWSAKTKTRMMRELFILCVSLFPSRAIGRQSPLTTLITRPILHQPSLSS